MAKREVSLADLNMAHDSEFDYDGFIIPLSINISKISSEDYAIAYSFLNKYKKKSVESVSKEHNRLDDIHICEFEDDTLTLSYKTLEYQYDIDILEEDKKMDYIFKFINTSDKLFNNNKETLLEYLQITDIKTWLLETGFTDELFLHLFKTISYWIDVLISAFHSQVDAALLINDKNGKSINYNLARLKICYETMAIYYFKENSDIKCYEELSYREQHLMQSYATKMYYIESAINKETRQSFEESKNSSKTKPKSSSFKRN